MKYGDVTFGQVEAFINKLGGLEAWNAVLRGEKELTVQEYVPPLLFNKHGRRIPRNLSTRVTDTIYDFALEQPTFENDVDYGNRILRMHGCLGINTEVTAEDFRKEIEIFLSAIREDPQTFNILNGPWLPILLPQVIQHDIGTVMELYLEAVEKSYLKTFPDGEFLNRYKGTFANQMEIVLGSGQYDLFEQMKSGPVVGIYFPLALLGFSISASQEQMESLPGRFVLSGLDSLIAMIMYPDVLFAIRNTPIQFLSAISHKSSKLTTVLGVGEDGIEVSKMDYLNAATRVSSSGLTFY